MPESDLRGSFRRQLGTRRRWLAGFGMTAMVTRDWPVDEARRFWALTSIDQIKQVEVQGLSRYDRGEPLPDGMFRREGQTFLREGKISRILWVRAPVIGQVESFPPTLPKIALALGESCPVGAARIVPARSARHVGTVTHRRHGREISRFWPIQRPLAERLPATSAVRGRPLSHPLIDPGQPRLATLFRTGLLIVTGSDSLPRRFRRS